MNLHCRSWVYGYPPPSDDSRFERLDPEGCQPLNSIFRIVLASDLFYQNASKMCNINVSTFNEMCACHLVLNLILHIVLASDLATKMRNINVSTVNEMCAHHGALNLILHIVLASDLATKMCNINVRTVNEMCPPRGLKSHTSYRTCK